MKTLITFIWTVAFYLPAILHAAIEVEPNNTFGTANSLVPDEAMSGQVASISDEDWFGFSVTSMTTIRVTFDSPENQSSSSVGYHTVQVRDGSGAVLASVDTGNDTVFHATAPSAGSYFIVVRDGPYAFQSTNQYTVTVTTQGSLPSTEIEPNNASADATSLSPAQTALGQIASESDQDWYSFSVGGAATATIVFDSPENQSSPSVTFHTIQVRDASGTIYSGVDTGEDKTFMVGLPVAGQYFIVVRDGPYAFLSTKQYSVTVTSTAPPAPTELQAIIYSAVEIDWNSQVGKTYVVEWSDNLSPASWLPLSPGIVGTGTDMGFLDSIRGNLRGFYRVQEY